MDKVTLDRVPVPVLAGFAGIGALWLSAKVVSYVRLLLSLFVFSGKNVSPVPSYVFADILEPTRSQY